MPRKFEQKGGCATQPPFKINTIPFQNSSLGINLLLYDLMESHTVKNSSY